MLSGFLVDFISAPVISGFTSGTSVIIILKQIKGVLGLEFKDTGAVDFAKKLFPRLNQIKVADAVLGACCIIFLTVIKVFQPANAAKLLFGSLKKNRRVESQC